MLSSRGEARGRHCAKDGEGSSTHGLVGIDAQGVGTAVDALQEGIESSEDDSTGTDVQESRL